MVGIPIQRGIAYNMPRKILPYQKQKLITDDSMNDAGQQKPFRLIVPTAISLPHWKERQHTLHFQLSTINSLRELHSVPPSAHNS